ncbi:MAG: hypothetical protein IPQ18_14860 [Saprospiraceae bacterium]|nr:hypothetical protein [Saprospiraceae bacterium]
MLEDRQRDPERSFLLIILKNKSPHKPQLSSVGSDQALTNMLGQNLKTEPWKEYVQIRDELNRRKKSS